MALKTTLILSNEIKKNAITLQKISQEGIIEIALFVAQNPWSEIRKLK
ncbi:MAG: hypothetical protein HUU50_11835 [Candidatus Brocadiae bacterium]|nr:hypothetical protein [Candidatus Brocadiia bacterium]